MPRASGRKGPRINAIAPGGSFRGPAGLSMKSTSKSVSPFRGAHRTARGGSKPCGLPRVREVVVRDRTSMDGRRMRMVPCSIRQPVSRRMMSGYVWLTVTYRSHPLWTSPGTLADERLSWANAGRLTQPGPMAETGSGSANRRPALSAGSNRPVSTTRHHHGTVIRAAALL